MSKERFRPSLLVVVVVLAAIGPAWTAIELPAQNGKYERIVAVGGGEWLVMWDDAVLYPRAVLRVDRSETITHGPVAIETGLRSPRSGYEDLVWNGTRLGYAFTYDTLQNDHFIAFMLLDRDGRLQSEPVDVAAGNWDDPTLLGDLEWGNGEFVVAYYRSTINTNETRLWIRRIDATGALASPEILVWDPSVDTGRSTLRVARLGTDIGLAWHLQNGYAPDLIMVAVLDPQGAFVLPPTTMVTADPTSTTISLAGFEAVPGKGFMLAYSEHVYPVEYRPLQLLLFDRLGSVIAGPATAFDDPRDPLGFQLVPADGGLGVLNLQRVGDGCTCLERRGMTLEGGFVSPPITVALSSPPYYLVGRDMAFQDGAYGFAWSLWQGTQDTRIYFGVAPGAGSFAASPGPSPASRPEVRIFAAAPGAPPPGATIVPYLASGYGAEVQAVDLDGDGTESVLTGPGPGREYGPQVRAFQISGAPMPKVSFFAYGTLKYGVKPTGGNIDGAGVHEIVAGPGPGEPFGPHVRGFAFGAGGVSAIGRVSFFAYSTLRYGANVATGDVEADGFEEILTGPGPGAVFSPQLRGFDYDGAAVAAITGLNAITDPSLRYGLTVAAGNLDAAGAEEIATGPGPGPYPSELSLFAYDGTGLGELPGSPVTPFAGVNGGVRSAIGPWHDGDFRFEIYASGGGLPGVPGEVRVLAGDGTSYRVVHAYDPYPGSTYGTVVAALEAGY